MSLSLLETIMRKITSQDVKIAILIIFGVLVFAGLVLIIFGIFSGLSKQAETAFSETAKRIRAHEKESEIKRESKLETFAKKLAKYIKINVYRRNKIAEQLTLVGSDLTPEEHIAIALTKASLFVIPGIIFSFISLWFLPVFLLVAFLIYRINFNTLNKKMEERRRIIDRSLPRFAATLSQTLKRDRDIVGFLKRFKDTAPHVFQIELEILIADMQTGNQRTAIMRSINRVGSHNYSDVMRGVMSVIDGSDSEIFWETLNEKLSEARRLELEDTAERIPRKLSGLMPLFVVGFVLQYIVVFGYYLSEQLANIL